MSSPSEVRTDIGPALHAGGLPKDSVHSEHSKLLGAIHDTLASVLEEVKTFSVRLSQLESLLEDLSDEGPDIELVDDSLSQPYPMSPVGIDETDAEHKAYVETLDKWSSHVLQENERMYGQSPSNLKKYSTSEKQAYEASGWDDTRVHWVAYRDGRRLYWIANLK